MEHLRRPECAKAIAQNLMIFIKVNKVYFRQSDEVFVQRNKLLRTEKALEWRAQQLQERENKVQENTVNLDRVWRNFTESVIQFAPIETTPEDALGISENAQSLSTTSEKDREELIKTIRSKREAANAMRAKLAEAWSEENAKKHSEVVSMEEMESKIRPLSSSFLTQPKVQENESIVILNKGQKLAIQDLSQFFFRLASQHVYRGRYPEFTCRCFDSQTKD